MNNIHVKVYVTKKMRTPPINVVYGSSGVGIEIEIMDYDLPAGSTAEARATGKFSTEVYKNTCTVDGNTITMYPETGFFVPGGNEFQVVITAAGKTILSFVMDAICDKDIGDGNDPSKPEQVLPLAKRAEVAAEKSEAAAARAQDVKDSIPADYTELSDGVNQIKNDLAELADIESVITIGVKWEQGTITSYGNEESEYRIRTKDYIPISYEDNKYIVPIINNKYKYMVIFYSGNVGNYSYLGETDYTNTHIKLVDNCTAIRVILKHTDNTAIVPNEHIEVILSYKSLFNDDVKSAVIDSFDFTSATDNLLDTSRYLTNYRLTDEYPYFVTNDNNAKLSYPIFVKGYKEIHIHSTATSPSGGRHIVFTKDKKMNGDSVVGYSKGLGSDKTDVNISVPDDAVWVYVTMSIVNTTSDWVNDTISYGSVATYDEYKKGGIVAIYDEYIDNNKFVNKYEEVVSDEERNIYKRFIPYAFGTPSTSLSFDDQYERANFVFVTDSHIDLFNPKECIQNLKDTVNFANSSNVNFDALIHTGDGITNYGSKNYGKGLLNQFFNILKKSTIPTIFSKGNHDLNDWDNPVDRVITDSDWSELWFDYAETKYGIVRQNKDSGNKSTWHYKDIESKKIRIISVDVQDTDKITASSNGDLKYHGGNSWYVSNEQLNWIANTALNFDDKVDKNWGVIVVMHQSMQSDRSFYSTLLTPKYDSSIKKLYDLLVAFNNQTTYSDIYSFENSFYNISLNVDFSRYSSTNNKPHIICCLNGHEHVDKTETYNGINIIWTANGSATSHSSDARLVRLLGTSTQNCFDILNIDTTHRKIRMFRFGAGINCYGVGGDRFLPDGLSY